MKIKTILSTLLLAAIPVAAMAKGEVYRDYEYTNEVTGDAPFHMSRNIMIINNDSVWAMQPFSWTAGAMERYAEVANQYKREFGDSMNVYLMPLPSQDTYYAPKSASEKTRPVRPALLHMLDAASDSVIKVDVYKVLGEHASEPIYSRTDHHWLPLGAYYAASELAKQAGLPFRTLDEYTAVTIPDFVGTMYQFSKDLSVKRNPEPFTYYVPKDSTFTTTYITYGLDKARRNIVSTSAEKEGKYFVKMPVSSSYCTFGGGDSKVIKVRTKNETGRRVMLVKDSFGNAMTPFLFGTFDEIHVIDSRYFNQNIKKYAHDNGITDIVICNNIFLGGTDRIVNNIKKYLVQ